MLEGPQNVHGTWNHFCLSYSVLVPRLLSLILDASKTGHHVFLVAGLSSPSSHWDAWQ